MRGCGRGHGPHVARAGLAPTRRPTHARGRELALWGDGACCYERVASHAMRIAFAVVALAACVKPGPVTWTPHDVERRPNAATVEDATTAAAQVLVELGDSPTTYSGAVYTPWGQLFDDQKGLRVSGRVAVIATKAEIAVEVQCKVDRAPKEVPPPGNACHRTLPPGDWQAVAKRIADRIVARISGAPTNAELDSAPLRPDGKSCFTRTALEGISTVCKANMAECEATRAKVPDGNPTPCVLSAAAK